MGGELEPLVKVLRSQVPAQLMIGRGDERVAQVRYQFFGEEGLMDVVLAGQEAYQDPNACSPEKVGCLASLTHLSLPHTFSTVFAVRRREASSGERHGCPAGTSSWSTFETSHPCRYR